MNTPEPMTVPEQTPELPEHLDFEKRYEQWLKVIGRDQRKMSLYDLRQTKYAFITGASIALDILGALADHKNPELAGKYEGQIIAKMDEMLSAFK